ncbi:MAG: flagellar basal-body MS-ring/collar protein FliF [Opitutaceae bacterium]
MKNFGQSLLALWKQLGLNQKVSLSVAALTVAGGLIAIVLWARRPDMTLLYGNLGEKDVAGIVSYLQAQNVPCQVIAGGTAVEVPSDQVYKLRMDLASKGMPEGDGVGFEIFDKGQFGLSDFVQRTNYMRALQGELARTIDQLQGVRASRVMIVQPENRLLLTDQSVKSTASVFVDLGGGTLQPEQVNAIRHLVANAVQGLQVNEVAVVDNHGHVLSEELNQDPALGTASSQMRYRQQVENYFAKKVQSMLDDVVGAGNAVVRVSADIDPEATTETEEKYDPDGQVVRTQTMSTESSSTTESHESGGAVGVSSNVPEKAGTGPAVSRPATDTVQNHKNQTTTYEIDRTLTNITRSPGTITRLTASVLVAQGATKRTPDQIEALKQIVINALGIKLAAGQSADSLITLEEMPFAAAPVAQEAAAIQAQGGVGSWVALASRWAAVVGAGAVLLIFLRLWSRQKPEPIPVEMFTLPPDLAARAMPNRAIVTPDMVNDLIRQKPANVGVALRGWVAANKN